jgi:REP element-mobilizing transposase RayT
VPFDSNRHHRRSVRLPGYDYTSAGAYFVTIVSRNRELLFEDSRFKEAAERAWLALPVTNSHVTLDQHVVMPNHFHGIIWLNGPRRGGSRTAPTDVARQPKSLGRLIGAFKTTSTKTINLLRNTPGVPIWQRNYYERIIRDDNELNRVRRYILDNPAKWGEDPENPTVAIK